MADFMASKLICPESQITVRGEISSSPVDHNKKLFIYLFIIIKQFILKSSDFFK